MRNRPLFLAALFAGTSYFFADAVTSAGWLHLVWKAAGVGLLAAWAARVARSRDGWLLAAAMAVYASADVLIELFGLTIGGAAFACGHVLMSALYLRHRRPAAVERGMFAALMIVAVVLVAFLLPDRRADGGPIAAYAVFLGAMAAAAMLSDFRRDRVLSGATLFVVSDLLIFSRLGPLAHSAIPDLGVWPLYFSGQALMTAGVARGLAERGA